MAAGFCLAVLSCVRVRKVVVLQACLKGRVTSSSSRSISVCIIQASASSSRPAWRRLPSFISPFLPFKDCKSVFLIKPSCDCKNTGQAGVRKPTTLEGKEELESEARSYLLPEGTSEKKWVPSRRIWSTRRNLVKQVLL